MTPYFAQKNNNKQVHKHILWNTKRKYNENEFTFPPHKLNFTNRGGENLARIVNRTP